MDHGKTALVKALTGVDTDRLKEEKERGITIELGFASLRLPSGRVVGVVDVPGHERFVRNMVAGASGIDLVVLVIAADEGVMPQTREHLHICTLLGIRKGFVALTKVDMVEDEWLLLVQEDVRAFLKGTFLEGAAVVPVSSVTGQGITDVVATLDKLAGDVGQRPGVGIFRLPVDRVFTMKGFGTVVTGTLVSGEVSVGQEVEVSPLGLRAKVRGLQVHNEPVEKAESGQRTAVNLQGVQRDQIRRGHVLAEGDSLFPSRLVDVLYRHLPGLDRPLKDRAVVRFHTGTSEIMAKVVLVGKGEVAPGEEAFLQLHLAEPLAAVSGDRYVLRSYSPVTTIGGGVIVDPLPKRHRRSEAGLLEDLHLLAQGEAAARLEIIMARAGLEGIDERRLAARIGICRRELRRLLEEAFSSRRAVLVDREERRVLSGRLYLALQERAVEELVAYHGRNPLKEGLSREELRVTLGLSGTAGQKIYSLLLRDLEAGGKIVLEKDFIRRPDHQVKVEGEVGDLQARILAAFQEGGLAPPTLKEIRERFPEHQTAGLLEALIRDGRLVRISGELVYHREVLEELRASYRGHLQREGKATPASFRELTGLSRKFVIPLMEYFDATKLTVRRGDERILRERHER